MNGMDAVGAPGAATPQPQGVGGAEEVNFDALIDQGLTQMGAYMMMFIASDVLEDILS